jgi:hypothetical protein
MNWKCWLGIHKWERFEPAFFGKQRRCTRCAHWQVWSGHLSVWMNKVRLP